MFRKTGLSILTAALLSALCAGAAAAGSLFSTASPAIAAAGNGKMYMVYRGTDPKDPNTLFWTEFDGSQWKAPSTIPGKYGILKSVASPALAFYNNKVELVYQGVQDPAGVYWATFDPVSRVWTDHQVLRTNTGDLKVVGTPAITGMNGMLYVIYQGQQPKNTIYWASHQNGIWTNLLNVNVP